MSWVMISSLIYKKNNPSKPTKIPTNVRKYLWPNIGVVENELKDHHAIIQN